MPRPAVQRHARPARSTRPTTSPTSGCSSTASPRRSSPGQYMTTGVFADGKLWQRPYSVASAPRSRGLRRLRVLRPPRADHAVHDAALAAADRPPDADDRPEGQVPPRAGRPPDAPLRLDRDRHRAVHLDDPPDDARRRRRAGRSSSTAARTWTSWATATSSSRWQRDGGYPLTTSRRSRGPTDPRNAGWTGRTGRVEADRGRRLPGARAASRTRRSSTSAATRR